MAACRPGVIDANRLAELAMGAGALGAAPQLQLEEDLDGAEEKVEEKLAREEEQEQARREIALLLGQDDSPTLEEPPSPASSSDSEQAPSPPPPVPPPRWEKPGNAPSFCGTCLPSPSAWIGGRCAVASTTVWPPLCRYCRKCKSGFNGPQCELR